MNVPRKKKVLFAYQVMMIGGSTTSLLSILNRIDYSKYDVDLLLNSHSGELLDMIPEEVNLLPPAYKYTDRKQEYLHRFLSPRYMFYYSVSLILAKIKKNPSISAQYRDMKDVEFYRNIDDEYDVAIAYLEGSVCQLVARHVKAKKKLAWIHVDYQKAGFDPKYDRAYLSLYDRIITVSEKCKESFDSAFPELASRSFVIENILSREHIQMMAKQSVKPAPNPSMINLITTCRITFDSKALDRAVAVIAKVKRHFGKDFSLRWYIIGDGDDSESLERQIKDDELQNNIFLLGSKKNPYPYLRGMSLFFLPSKREGKPMAVTEAFMMGLPALVTEYSSAREQVRDGVDGIIVENSEQGIYDGLIRIIEHPEIIDELKQNVLKTDYSNVEEMEKIIQLIEG